MQLPALILDNILHSKVKGSSGDTGEQLVGSKAQG